MRFEGGTIMAQFHIISGAEATLAHPAIRKIGFGDLKQALIHGMDDFAAMRSDVVFLCLIYPLVGIVLAGLTLGYDILPMLFPLAAGFALIGPLAAVHLYELSRRREAGLGASWRHGFDVFHSPSFPSIAAVGVVLMLLFVAWLGTAKALYVSLFGLAPPESISTFLTDVFTTPAGWKLIVIGNALGFVFAVVAFTLSVVSFPLLLDRDVGAAAALLTSVRAVAANPITMAGWGLIVAGLLLLGSLPLFVGLAVVIPVLGHSTWHLYRRVVGR
jgi:uncharacterized membrane protein